MASSRKRSNGTKSRMSRARPFEPPSDALILAAVDRAERHRPPHLVEVPGVLFAEVVEHLGLVHSPWTTRRVRPHVERLHEAGLLGRSRRDGSYKWSLMPAGRRRLAAARRKGDLGELPESPQHRAWREAREEAKRRIGGLRDDVQKALRDGDALLDVEHVVGSDAWFDVADRLKQACWRLGSATHCLYEWSEPDDRRVDIDELRDAADKTLGRDERARRRQLRAGRRNTWSWKA